jgi:hypothetical protein
MANFCPKCGSRASGGNFCLACGTSLGAQSAATPLAAAPPAGALPSPMAPKGSSLLKVVLIGIVLVFVLGAAGVIGAVYFIKSKVHDKVAEIKARTGVDLPAMMDDARKSHPSGERRDGCLVLSKDEAQAIVGFALTRAEGAPGNGTEEHCDYYADPAAIQEVRDNVKNALESLRNGQARSGDLSKVEEITKSISAGVNNGSAPILQITIYRGDARLTTSAFNAGTALMGFKGEQVKGPWDEATFGPLNSTLTVRKGDNGVMIDLRQVPGGREKGLALAAAIAARL